MQRPSFQFYPGDWQSNKNLRRCTKAEKCIWLDVMCLMHDSEEYGILRWPLEELAQAAGCEVSDLRSLQHKGVLKGADPGEECAAYIYVPRSGRKDGDPVTLVEAQFGPIWYCSRFVKDEYKRGVRGDETRFPKKETSPPDSPTDSPSDSSMGAKGETNSDSKGAAPMGAKGDGSSSSSSSSSSMKTNDDGDEEKRPPIETPVDPLKAVEDYLKGRTKALLLGGRDLTAVRDWLQFTGGDVDVIRAGVDAGLLIFRADYPGQLPDGARFYTAFVRKEWDRHTAGGDSNGRAAGSAGNAQGQAVGHGTGRERQPAGRGGPQAVGAGETTRRPSQGGPDYDALTRRPPARH